MSTPTNHHAYLIWSCEHKAYWAPNSKGYTRKRSEAGRYGYNEAAEICQKANRHLRDSDEPMETMLEA